MIDIHSHILYDIEGDDGSRSLDMSLGMLRQAAASGVTDMFATPHMHRRGVVPSWASIVERAEQLQEEADKAGIPVRIHTGAEVSFDADTMNYLPDGGTDYCLAGTHYILIELLPSSAPESTGRLIYELQLRGYQPILAHPERYPNIMEKPDHLLHWIEKGLLTQSNIGSFCANSREKQLPMRSGSTTTGPSISLDLMPIGLTGAMQTLAISRKGSMLTQGIMIL